jgi:hypothetical protein
LAGETDSDTTATTVTAADADLVGSATLVAVTDTMPADGTTDGPVYNPPDETVPTVESPPATPFTHQVTPVFVVFVTLAVNCCVPDVGTDALVGEMDTETGTTIVAVAEAIFVVSATLVAAIVTVAGEGRVGGAVYNPPEETVPSVELPPAVPFTLQVTPVFVVPLAAAVNC